MECPLCRRVVPLMSGHHLVPKSRGGKHQDKLPICVDCHNAIHAMFSNRELEREFNSLQALLENERFRRHVRWLSRQDPGKRLRSRTARDQRRRRRSR